MKVLNISTNDWANYSYSNAVALRSVGVKCDGLKIYPHSFGTIVTGKHHINHQND